MQVMMVMTAICCYLFWIVTFIAQLNPLFGPTLSKDIIILMQEEWVSCMLLLPPTVPPYPHCASLPHLCLLTPYVPPYPLCASLPPMYLLTPLCLRTPT